MRLRPMSNPSGVPPETEKRRFWKFSRADLEEIVGLWDDWWAKEHPEAYRPISELYRRSRRARLHPETLTPHEEAMRQIREKLHLRPR
jgi:hypothetical protein